MLSNNEQRKKNSLISVISDDCIHHLNFAICDDDEMQLEELSNIIRQTAPEEMIQIGLFPTADALLADLEQKKNLGERLPDVIFTDIKMPGMDGISFGKKIAHFSPDICLIFITAYAEYAVQGYEAKAFRYLLKPILPDDITPLLFEIMQERGKRKKLCLETPEHKWLLPLQDIMYISAEDKYTIVYTQAEHYIDRTSLNDYEQLLKPYGFYRIHRKYIVNPAYHKGIGKGKICLTNNLELPISRRKQSAYYTELLHHLEKELL